MIQFNAAKIDLRAAIQEEVVMVLPMRALCHADGKYKLFLDQMGRIVPNL